MPNLAPQAHHAPPLTTAPAPVSPAPKSELTMAFQPIVDVEAESVWGYEAFVRGTAGQTAGDLLKLITPTNQFHFDVACRTKAIELASNLLPKWGATRLSINVIPDENTASQSAIRATLKAAQQFQFDPRRITVEFNESNQTRDLAVLTRMVQDFQRCGFKTAIDDFGLGRAGLALLARVQTEMIKVDMELVSGISISPAKQMIVAGIVAIAKMLNVEVAAEGVETVHEVRALKAAGIRLQQGFYFARPEVGALPVARTSHEVG